MNKSHSEKYVESTLYALTKLEVTEAVMEWLKQRKEDVFGYPMRAAKDIDSAHTTIHFGDAVRDVDSHLVEENTFCVVEAKWTARNLIKRLTGKKLGQCMNIPGEGDK
jgi:hypothetical protein